MEKVNRGQRYQISKFSYKEKKKKKIECDAWGAIKKHNSELKSDSYGNADAN